VRGRRQSGAQALGPPFCQYLWCVAIQIMERPCPCIGRAPKTSSVPSRSIKLTVRSLRAGAHCWRLRFARMRRIVVLAAVAGLAGVATVASGFSAQRVSDPPLIVPWHQIGSVGIGESRTRVTYDYGRPQVADFYLLHGGRLEVAYANDRVTWLYLERTRFHETPKGVGIGFRVPLGACHLVKGSVSTGGTGFGTGRTRTASGHGSGSRPITETGSPFGSAHIGGSSTTSLSSQAISGPRRR
jgi:hypothetical protein